MRSRPVVIEHQALLPGWNGPDIQIVVLSDFHVAAPFTSLHLIRRIVRATLDMAPDLVVLAGDFLADGVMVGKHATAQEIVHALDDLRAPLGVFAILGNHDWQDCAISQATNYRENSITRALDGHHIRLLRNQCETVSHQGHELNIAGFDSQRPVPKDWSKGLHRPDDAFAAAKPGIPTLLLAHEPDYFASRDARAAVQISGHTHGGQLNLMGWRPLVPSQFGPRFAHGHIQEDGRSLFVSGGLGFPAFRCGLGNRRN